MRNIRRVFLALLLLAPAGGLGPVPPLDQRLADIWARTPGNSPEGKSTPLGDVGFPGSSDAVAGIYEVSTAGVLFLDRDGMILSQESDGEAGSGSPSKVGAAVDGGFVVLCRSTTFIGTTMKYLGILKLNTDGSMAWKQTILERDIQCS